MINFFAVLFVIYWVAVCITVIVVVAMGDKWIFAALSSVAILFTSFFLSVFYPYFVPKVTFSHSAFGPGAFMALLIVTAVCVARMDWESKEKRRRQPRSQPAA